MKKKRKGEKEKVYIVLHGKEMKGNELRLMYRKLRVFRMLIIKLYARNELVLAVF